MTDTTDSLRALAAELLDEAKAGTAKPTVTELARRAGTTRPTLYRNHPATVAEFLSNVTAVRSARTRPTRPTQALGDRIAKLRRENEDLLLHCGLYEEHIRRLTVDNHRLTEKLAALNSVTILEQHRRAKTNLKP